jgi:hypothetical protein
MGWACADRYALELRRSFGVANSYTIEISFLGHAVNGTMVHFKIEDLEKIGRDFAVRFFVLRMPCLARASSPTVITDSVLMLLLPVTRSPS